MKKMLMAAMLLSTSFVVQCGWWDNLISLFWSNSSVENDKLLQSVKKEINSQNKFKITMPKGGTRYLLDDSSYSDLMGMIIDGRGVFGLESDKYKELLQDINGFLDKNKQLNYTILEQKMRIRKIKNENL